MNPYRKSFVREAIRTHAMRRKLVRSFVHNCLVHPLCFVADALEAVGIERFSTAIDGLHDRSAPLPKEPDDLASRESGSVYQYNGSTFEWVPVAHKD